MRRRERLIELIYTGVDTDDVWPKALAQIAGQLRVAGAGIGLQDMRTHEFRGVASVGIDDSLGETYQRCAPGNKVWQTIACTGRPQFDAKVMAKSEFVSTPLYQQWFVPQEFYSVMAAPVLASGDQSGVVVAFGSKRRDFDEPDVRPLAHLARHIGLALRLRLGREQMLQELRVQQLVLDQLQDGILIIDAHLRIQHANAKAQALMARRDVLRLRDGCIHCRDPASHAELSRMTRTAPGTPNGGWFTVPQEGRRPLLIDVIALRISGETGTKPAFALRIRDPDRQHVPTALQLQRLLGLTLGESKAVLAIMQTPSQEAAAQRLGRGVTTLRTQLHHAYGKLGVHDPAGLARLLAAYGFAQPPQMR